MDLYEIYCSGLFSTSDYESKLEMWNSTIYPSAQ